MTEPSLPLWLVNIPGAQDRPKAGRNLGKMQVNNLLRQKQKERKPEPQAQSSKLYLALDPKDGTLNSPGLPLEDCFIQGR